VYKLFLGATEATTRDTTRKYNWKTVVGG